MHITADRDACVGAGRCAATVPEVFDSGDDGLVVVVDAEPDATHRDDVAEAVRLCPAAALSLHDTP